jgi:hypothetical protein
MRGENNCDLESKRKRGVGGRGKRSGRGVGEVLIRDDRRRRGGRGREVEGGEVS